MRRSWVELSNILSEILEQQNYQNLIPVLENVLSLNESYATKPLYFDRIDSCVKELSALVIHSPDDSEPDKSASNEQMTKKIQALSHCIKEVVDSKIKPLMHRQTWYMQRMRALGYNITMLGECYGLSNMAIQAFFANDMDTFNKRLHTIYDTPLEDFENDFANLRAQKQAFLEKEQYVEANEIDEKIIDLYAFFDGVALHQQPKIYFHDEENQPLSQKQDARKTMPITMPVTLEGNENTPCIITSFVGTYRRDNLVDYFTMLQRELGEHSFALNLLALNHAITLTWNSRTKCWLLLDPNHLPGEEYIRLEHLADTLCEDFGFTPHGPGYLMVGTQITTTTQHTEVMQRQFKHLKATPDWVKLQNAFLTGINVRGQMMTQQELYDLHYTNPDSFKWDDLQILDEALDAGLNDVITRLIITKGLEPFLGIENNKLRALLLAISQQHQHDLLEQLSVDKKIAIISGEFLYSHALFQILPEPERLSVFLKFSSDAQRECLNELSKAGQIEERNSLLQHLTIDQKAVVANMQMLTNDERLPVFLKLTSNRQADYLAKLTPVEMVDYGKNLFEQLSLVQKSNIILDRFLSPSPSKRDDIKILLQMLHNDEYSTVFLNLQPHEQGKCMVILSSPPLTAQRDSLLEKLSIGQKITIIEHYKDISVEGVECLTAIMKSLPESAHFEAVKKQNKDGQTIIHRAAKHMACLTVLLNSLSVQQRIVAVQIKDNNRQTALYLAENSDSLDMILKIYPEDERLEALLGDEQEHPTLTFLRQAFFHDELLSVIVNNLPHDLPSEDRPEKLRSVRRVLSVLFEVHNEALSSSPNRMTAISAILSGLPEKQLIEAIKEKQSALLFRAFAENPSLLSAYLNRLSESTRLQMIHEIKEQGHNLLLRTLNAPSRSVTMIMNIYPEKERFNALMRKDAQGFSVLDYSPGRPNFMIAILAELNVDERFEVLKMLENEPGTFELPELFSEMKKILLDKIESTGNKSAFEPVKQSIINAITYLELKDELQKLNHLHDEQKHENDMEADNVLSRSNQTMIKSKISQLKSDPEGINKDNQPSRK